MRIIILFSIFTVLCRAGSAQKQVQTLQPSRVGIFKNGTCFVKREGTVKVTEKSFYINAPDKVLMGTYWVFVGKESSMNSIVVKADTFKVKNRPKYLMEFLEVSVGQIITLYRTTYQATETNKVSGKLLEYDKETGLVRIEGSNGKVTILDGRLMDWIEVVGNPKGQVTSDSILAVARIKLAGEAESTLVSTISLERGMQWFPSYLFTIVNEKEAKLEMKATIATGETEYRNMPVDIIIGNPEMFYGKTLDPVCIDYLKESMLEGRYDNNGFLSNFNIAAVQTQTRSTGGNYDYSWDDEDNANDKEGSKLEDLYYYQLGVHDLEKNSRIIVPVMTATISYSEIYTANLPLNSTVLEGNNSIQTFHSYLINNTSNAPLTSGASLVLNQRGQPLAQAQLNYTPVKGSSEMQLSKAVDVQVKNDEEETQREKSNIRRNASSYYEKAYTSGIISLTNYKDKKITMRVTKKIEGIYLRSDNSGKSRKVKTGDDDSETITELYWEVEVPAGGKLQLKYDYYILD